MSNEHELWPPPPKGEPVAFTSDQSVNAPDRRSVWLGTASLSLYGVATFLWFCIWGFVISPYRHNLPNFIVGLGAVIATLLLTAGIGFGILGRRSKVGLAGLILSAIGLILSLGFLFAAYLIGMHLAKPHY